jgi:uncharacterized protein YcfL
MKKLLFIPLFAILLTGCFLHHKHHHHHSDAPVIQNEAPKTIISPSPADAIYTPPHNPEQTPPALVETPPEQETLDPEVDPKAW